MKNVRRTFAAIFGAAIIAAAAICGAAICGAAAGRGYISSAERVRVAYNAISAGAPYHIATEALSRDECENLDRMISDRPIKIYINEEV